MPARKIVANPLTLLRTEHVSFQTDGSGLSKTPLRIRLFNFRLQTVNLSVAVWVKQNKIADCVISTMNFPYYMVVMPFGPFICSLLTDRTRFPLFCGDNRDYHVPHKYLTGDLVPRFQTGGATSASEENVAPEPGCSPFWSGLVSTFSLSYLTILAVIHIC